MKKTQPYDRHHDDNVYCSGDFWIFYYSECNRNESLADDSGRYIRDRGMSIIYSIRHTSYPGRKSTRYMQHVYFYSNFMIPILELRLILYYGEEDRQVYCKRLYKRK